MHYSKLKKPLKAKTVVHAATAGSKEEGPVPVPILAALPTETEEESGLLVAHGSTLKPKFETVVGFPWVCLIFVCMCVCWLTSSGRISGVPFLREIADFRENRFFKSAGGEKSRPRIFFFTPPPPPPRNK